MRTLDTILTAVFLIISGVVILVGEGVFPFWLYDGSRCVPLIAGICILIEIFRKQKN